MKATLIFRNPDYNRVIETDLAETELIAQYKDVWLDVCPVNGMQQCVGVECSAPIDGVYQDLINYLDGGQQQ